MAVTRLDKRIKTTLSKLDQMYNGCWLLVTDDEFDARGDDCYLYAVGDGDDNDFDTLHSIASDLGLSLIRRMKGCSTRGEENLHTY